MDDSEVEGPTKGVRFAAPRLMLRGVLVRRPRKPRPMLAALPPTSADPSVLKGLKLRKAGAVEDVADLDGEWAQLWRALADVGYLFMSDLWTTGTALTDDRVIRD